MFCQTGLGIEPGPSALKASALPIELTWQTKEDNDLGVLITNNLKPVSQCAAAVNKTMSALRCKKLELFRY